MQFIDRNSVVRQGGEPRRRTPVAARGGRSTLWQSRLQQFSEQSADPSLAGTTNAQIAAQFAFLPPVGLLPPDAVNLQTHLTDFFPATWSISAIPAPIDQLDMAIRESAGLTEFDRSVPSQVEILFPSRKKFSNRTCCNRPWWTRSFKRRWMDSCCIAPTC